MEVYEAKHTNCYNLILLWEGGHTTAIISEVPLVFDEALLDQSYVEVEEIELRGTHFLNSVVYKPDFPAFLLVDKTQRVIISKVTQSNYTVERKDRDARSD